MIEIVLDIEAYAIASTRWSENVALILFDCAAAFPAVARAFIWMIHLAVGIPYHIIKAIHKLYVKNEHFFQMEGSSVPCLWFTIWC